MGALGSYKESKGTVCRKNGRTVWVALLPDCTAIQGCKAGCGSCGGKKERGKIMAATDDPARFTLGQSVTLRYYELNELLGALIVFGIPLACAMLSLIVWYLVSPAAVESGPSLLSAGTAFVAGFFIVRIIDRTFRTAFPSQIVAPDDVASVTSLPVMENKSDG